MIAPETAKPTAKLAVGAEAVARTVAAAGRSPADKEAVWVEAAVRVAVRAAAHRAVRAVAMAEGCQVPRWCMAVAPAVRAGTFYSALVPRATSM